jgi:glycosyltransferase involved in cell wall biosynthesis
MVVPIRMGAGTRVKIVHGFSRKCPIVSTSLGAHGYDVADGRELYLADSPEQFSSACIKAVREPKQAAEMADRAWREFLEKWTWEAVRPRVWAAAEDCLRSSPESPSVSQQTQLY